MSCSTKTPWKNGSYILKGMPTNIYTVEGENVIWEGVFGRVSNHATDPKFRGTWKYGDFGEAIEEVAVAAEKKRYNIDISLPGAFIEFKGIVSDDGMSIFIWGWTNSVDVFEWKDKESILKLRESGDPADAPPSPYKIQPENQGKFLFISGAPGLGKSTTAQLLGRKAGFVFYEGDCFWSQVNPYIDVNADQPSLASLSQKFLKGLPQDRIDVCASAENEIMAMFNGKEYDNQKILDAFSAMSKDIAKERKRLGGDWAMAMAVPKRAHRDHIKAELGPDLVFVVLNMTKGDQKARIKARHGDKESSAKDMLLYAYDLYEPATADEKNAIDVLITPEMSPDDVVDKILEMTKEYK